MSHAVLVASPGGHIDELRELAERLPAAVTQRTWLTAHTPQTRSMLAGEAVLWVPPVGPRQALRAVGSVPSALAMLRHLRPSLVVSTGAALAIPYLLAARALHAPAYFIDSATRLDAPSVSGRLAGRVPGVRLFHQGMATPPARWHDVGSVFDGFRALPGPERAPHKVLVTLGTERFPFHRALTLLAAALPDNIDITWQTGHTSPSAALPGTVRPWIPYEELRALMQSADLVITHAGVGSVLTALRLGQLPVVLPRRQAFGEHIDDHQAQLAALIEARGLAAVAGSGQGASSQAFMQSARRAVGCSVLRERTTQEPLPLRL